MSVKYQVFVSSTYEDLKRERDVVIKAILEMGHIPVGMEMFSAADEEQWRIIARQIEQSDYYVCLCAHRYGSMTGGVSYTEKEYDYAVSQGVPALGFLLDTKVPWPPEFVETDTVKKDSLAAFQVKLKQKPISYWQAPADLHGLVSVALMKTINSQPRPGWVRTPKAIGPEVTVELSRLSSDNAALRQRIEELTKQMASKAESDTLTLMSTLTHNEISVTTWPKGATSWTPKVMKSLSWLFMTLAPELAIEQSTETIAALVAVLSSGKLASNFRDTWPVPSNSVKAWLSSLMALGLVAPSMRKRPIKDTAEYWTLTPAGSALYLSNRRRTLEKMAAEKEQQG